MIRLVYLSLEVSFSISSWRGASSFLSIKLNSYKRTKQMRNPRKDIISLNQWLLMILVTEIHFKSNTAETYNARLACRSSNFTKMLTRLHFRLVSWVYSRKTHIPERRRWSVWRRCWDGPPPAVGWLSQSAGGKCVRRRGRAASGSSSLQTWSSLGTGRLGLECKHVIVLCYHDITVSELAI